MSIQRFALRALLLGFIASCVTGCVVQRTVRDGDEVVAQGYVVKAPLLDR